jgi:hypothetical protein
MSLTGIDFFMTQGFSGDLFGATYQLSLSVITTDINSLSGTNFDGNIGAGNTLFTVATLAGPAPDKLTFSGGPFFYNPSVGNLLLDIQIDNIAGSGGATNSSTLPPAFQDGDGGGPAGITRYSNFATGTTGFGLVTQFDFSIPEPGTSALLGCGMAGIFVRRGTFRKV